MQYRIVYRKGAKNRAADALSRSPPSNESCAAMTTLVPSWLTLVSASYEGDSFVQDMITKLSLDPKAAPNYSLQAAILRYKNRIWIGSASDIQHRLIATFHDSVWGGHSGVPVTHMRLKQCFAWRGMRNSVHQFVRACTICQQSKPDRAKSLGLLQPLPVLSTTWQVISLDFVEGLPLSATYNCVVVVADLLTKYAHFIPLRHPFTAAGVARSFLN
jgi:hypothetical protein